MAAPMAEVYDILNDFKWDLVASIPVVLVLASAGGYWMNRRALAPVDGITSTARSISEHNLSMRLSIPATGDELQRLSETFNQMRTAWRELSCESPSSLPTLHMNFGRP
jgi:HAMP domain-containing protein